MILVVGGAGFIGSHILKLLREAKEPHLVFDSFENGHRFAVGASPWIQGDLRTKDEIASVFAARRDIDLVMHFAAYISVGESVREPGKYFRNNAMGTLNLLEAMRAAEVDKLVFSSTAAVYGEPHSIPITEDHPREPLNPYGFSKYAVERMLEAFDVAHGFKSVSLRYFNAAGADPEAIYGEDHEPEEHLIPLALLAAAGKRDKLTIFGTDYDTPDGTCVRDYVHVLDLARAHLSAVGHLRAGGESRAYNLGNGRGFSVKEVLETASRVVGSPIPHESAPRRPGDAATLIASSKAIREDWGWFPEYPDLETIIRHAWQWRLSHPNGYADRAG